MDFPALFSSAEMGHQLQLVGVTLLGVAMTASERAGEDGERAALAQHHMGSCQPITPGAAPAPAPARPGPGGQRGVTAGAAGAGGGLVAGLPRKRAGIASGEDSAAEAAPAASPAIRASSNPCGSLRTFFSRD